MVPEADSNQTNESSEDGASGPIGGERLSRARHVRGISVREIAKELHLDEPKVRALEENRFEELGAPVFAKGHLRKYAQLVGVPIDDILADYYQLNRSAGAPPVVGRPRKVRRQISIAPWALSAVVILMAAAWWWSSLTPSSEPAAVRTTPSAPVESGRAAVTGGESRQEPKLSSAETGPEVEPGLIETEPVAEAMRQVADGSVELELAFTGDCWTEVTDATGKRLFFALGSAGRTVRLSGVEPLGVLLGDSSNVIVRVNGYDYMIPAANRRGNTARLTIYGQ